MGDVAKKSSWLFGKVDDSNVERIIRIISNLWYAFAALQAVGLTVLYFGHQAALGDLLDPLGAALAGYFLQARKSRALAIVLFLYSLLILGITIANRFGFGHGGTNFILALIVVYMGWRAIPATFFYQKRRCAELRWLRIVLNSLVTAAVVFVSIFVVAFGIGFTMGLGGSVSQPVQDLTYAAGMFFPAALVMAGLTLRWPFTEPDAACPWPPRKAA